MAGIEGVPLLENEITEEDEYFDIYRINDPVGDVINERGNMGFGLPEEPAVCLPRPRNKNKVWVLNHQEAAIFLQEGENNDKYLTHPRSHDALPAYEIAHNDWFYTLDLAAALLVLGVAASERPAVSFLGLPVGVHGSLEIFGLLILSLELGIRMKWLGWRVYIQHKRTAIKTFFLIVMFTEALVVLVRQTNHFRVTRAFRPLFLLNSHYCRGVRRIARQTLQSLPPIFDMLGLLLFVMLIFSILGFYLFSPIDNCPYFKTIQDSFISLFILLTTANFPDVMMPAYNASRYSALFFIAYLAIELYFVMNLFLAVVYDTFSSLEKTKLRKLFFHKREGCQFAFRLLTTKSDPKHINLRSFLGLLEFYRPKLSKKDGYLLFKAMNTEKSGQLSLEEFYKIYHVCDLKWKSTSAGEQIWSSNFRHPCNKLLRYLNGLVKLKYFDAVVYLVILANFIWILVETIQISVKGLEVRTYNFSITEMSIVFVSLYCIEAMLKILGRGPVDYFTTGWDVFDFLVTVTSVVGILGTEFADGFYYITVLRPFRLLRLFKIKKRYRDVLGTLFVLLNRLTSLVIVIVLVYYFFAIIGIELYLNQDLSNCCQNTSVEAYYRFSNDTATDGFYYLNNFENIFASGVTLFELTVVNNWFIIMEGYAHHVSEWTRVYFMVFYIVMMFVMNIVVAFILELFLFRIQYRRQMHLQDFDDHEKYKVDISLNEEEEYMCESARLIITGNHIISQSHSPSMPTPYTYRGERVRSKEDFSLRMYSDEVKSWIKEESTQRESTISELEEQRVRPRPNSHIL